MRELRARKKKRVIAELIMTALASPLLMLLGFELDGTSWARLAAPLYAPGLMVAGFLVPLRTAGRNVETYLGLAFAVNFVFLWIVLLALLKVLQVYVGSKLKSAN